MWRRFVAMKPQALAEPPRQGSLQLRQQAFAISRPGLAALLELHYMPADVPIGLDLNRVHLAQHLLAGLQNQAAQGVQQEVRWGVDWDLRVGMGHGVWDFSGLGQSFVDRASMRVYKEFPGCIHSPKRRPGDGKHVRGTRFCPSTPAWTCAGRTWFAGLSRNVGPSQSTDRCCRASAPSEI